MAKATQRANGQGAAGGGSGGSAAQRGRGDSTEDVHTEFLQRIEEWYRAEYNNIMEGRDCQLFYAGGKAQWDEKAWNTRQTKNRPSLTINRLPQFVRQATGDIRKNPPSLKFLPAKGQASQETAEALNGLARHIEQQSQAKDVYVKAVENAAQAGQGFFTVDCEYSDDDSFEQDIRIRPVLDPFGAGVDPFASRFDKSDMRYGFVFGYRTEKQYQEEFPDKAMVSIPREGFGQMYPWRVNDVIIIAEYWRRVAEKRTIYLLQSGAIVDDKKMIPPNDAVKSEREVSGYRVESYVCSGADVLSGPHPWAGRYIPICMVVGEEITQSGSTVRKGMVHDARDPQRIYNYARSASVEAVALQPKAPWTGTVDMFKGRAEWATAGSENHAFLAFNPDPKMPGGEPKRAQPAIASQGMDTQATIAAQDMQAVTGIYNDNLGAPSSQHSGVAINAKKVEGDTGTFLYPDNLSRAIGYAGKIMCDLMPKIYDTERQIRILKEDGGADMITINGKVPQLNDSGEKLKPLYDLQMGEYDVIVTTGPSFATQRAEAAQNMIAMIQAQPKLFDLAGDLLVKNMDWPGADELAKRIEKTMPPGLIGDGPIEKPPPPPGVQEKAARDAAAGMKDSVLADKTKAETEGIHIANATAAVQLQATLAGIGEAIQQIQGFMQALQPGGAGGSPGPAGGPPPNMPPGGGAPMNGPPVPMPPPGPPPGGPGDLPMVEVGGAGPPSDLPMVEVGPPQ